MSDSSKIIVRKIVALSLLMASALLNSCVATRESKSAPEAEFQGVLKRARHGDGWAQFRAGQIYENGIGVSANIGLAIKYYRAASKSGHISVYQPGVGDVVKPTTRNDISQDIRLLAAERLEVLAKRHQHMEKGQ